MQLQGGHEVAIGGSRRIALAAARLATDARRGHDRRPLTRQALQAQQELGQVHAIVMDMTNEAAVEKGFAGLRFLDHVLISAGSIRNGPMYTMTSLRHVR
jgi:NAD(P)-dependent dehydrogenase (short-subunit alcohol dehydrogenase family)